MAGVLHKFLKKPSALRIITRFNDTQPSNLVAPFAFRQTHLSESIPDYPYNPSHILDSLENDKPTNPQPSQIYPSFPFGYYLNHVSPTMFDLMESEDAEDVGSGDTRSVWADSVKKKRKRKMNKHKYKKLRKRLRRKT